ncbi:hypothetical protein AAMO2058_000742600 [Amorphochlora amoebiformis]
MAPKAGRPPARRSSRALTHGLVACTLMATVILTDVDESKLLHLDRLRVGIAGSEPCGLISEGPGTSAALSGASRIAIQGTKDEKKKIKQAQKAEKVRLKAELKLRQERERMLLEIDIRRKLSIINSTNSQSSPYGTFHMIQSAARTGRRFTRIGDLKAYLHSNTTGSGQAQVWVRARIHRIRSAGKLVFLVLRQGLETVQAVIEKSTITDPDPGTVQNATGNILQFARKILVPESIVDIRAVVRPAEVIMCSQNELELSVERIYVVASPSPDPPFQIQDADRGVTENGVRVLRDLRLDNRVVDIRAPSHHAVFAIRSEILYAWSQFLHSNGFIQIHTPKLLKGASEGGAEVFLTNYFGRTACLAQSPQLHKQMAIAGDMRRVFEIGPMFRAELSHTQRHLCEFVGLDLEMEIDEHYLEAVDMVEYSLVYSFDHVKRHFGQLISRVQKHYNATDITYLPAGLNPRLTFQEAVSLLRENGFEAGDFDDLSSEQEMELGRIIKDRYGTDLFTITGYPRSIRPFYTMVNSLSPMYTNSYDIFLRGQEIASGAQRIHDRSVLAERIKEKGINETTLGFYLDAFRHGVPPHAGAGLGFDRLVMLYLGLGNIREASLFPRDPRRLAP